MDSHNIKNDLIKMSTEDPVVKMRSTMYGRIGGENACGNCADEDTWIKGQTNLSIPNEYTYKNIDTDGKDWASKNNVDNIPATVVCDVHQSGKENCQTYVGLDDVKKHITKYAK